MKKPSLEALGIRKAFSGNTVLSDVNFVLQTGEIHALLGHNGAGKSTLMKILLGVYTCDEGKIKVHGNEVSISNPQDARNNGLAIVHQELNLFPHLTIAENMFLGREFTHAKTPRSSQSMLGWAQRVEKRTMKRMCAKHLARVGLNLDPDEQVDSLSMGKRQLIEIARALSEEANVLILDEPTSSLSTHEAKTLFHIMRQLSSEGVSIIFISHRMEEVFEICDRITVMRDGRVIDTVPVDQTDTETVIEMMIGKSIDHLYGEVSSHAQEHKETVLKVIGLTAPGVFEDVSLEVRQGEIVGLAGLVGAGRTEVLESIFGLRAYSAGNIEYGGAPIRFRDPTQAVLHGIGLVPEDRRGQGLFMKMNVLHNLSMIALKKLLRIGMVDTGQETRLTNEYIGKLNIKTTGGTQPISELSGGNQQKVVIAKWFAGGIRLLLLDEPTRGVDINAKSEIYALIKRFVADGGSVLMVSSELPEVIGLSDRIFTFKKGRVTGELKAEEATENKVMVRIV